MAKISKIVSAFAITVSIASLAVSSAEAQNRSERPAAAPAAPQVSRAFGTAYQAANTAIQAATTAQAEQAAATPVSWTAAETAVAALHAAATAPYEHFLSAQADFRIASGKRSVPGQLAAVDAMIASEGIPAANQPGIFAAGGQLAYNAQDFTKAASRIQRAIELGSTTEGLPVLYLDALARGGQIEQLLTVSRAAIASATAAGTVAPDAYYSFPARALQEADRNAELADWLVKRAQAYPTPGNVRSAGVAYLQNTPDNRGITLDVLRLMTAAQAMSDRRFFLEYAAEVAEEGLPNEAMTVIAAGRASGLIPATDRSFNEIEASQRDKLAEDRASLAGAERRAMAAPDARLATLIGDAYLSYNNNEKAESLYTAALGKTGADVGLINTHLAIARFHAGNMDGALQALALVQDGRAPIARMWEAVIKARQAAAAPAPAAAAPAASATAQ